MGSVWDSVREQHGVVSRRDGNDTEWEVSRDSVREQHGVVSRRDGIDTEWEVYESNMGLSLGAMCRGTVYESNMGLSLGAMGSTLNGKCRKRERSSQGTGRSKS